MLPWMKAYNAPEDLMARAEIWEDEKKNNAKLFVWDATCSDGHNLRRRKGRAVLLNFCAHYGVMSAYVFTYTDPDSQTELAACRTSLTERGYTRTQEGSPTL